MSMATEREVWATVKQAAARLHRDPRTVRRWIEKKQIPVDRTGPVILVDISGHLSEQEQGTAYQAQGMPVEVEALRLMLAAAQSERDFLRQELAKVSSSVTALTATIAQQNQLLLEAPRQEPATPQAYPTMPEAEAAMVESVEQQVRSALNNPSRWELLKAFVRGRG